MTLWTALPTRPGQRRIAVAPDKVPPHIRSARTLGSGEAPALLAEGRRARDDPAVAAARENLRKSAP